MKKIIFILIIIGFWYFLRDVEFIKKDRNNKSITLAEISTTTEKVVSKKEDTIKMVEIIKDSTYGDLMKELGVDYGEAMEIYALAKDEYDLVKIRLGRFLKLTFDSETEEFKKLEYKIDSEEELIIEKNNISTSTSWTVVRKDINYEVRQKIVSGTIESSLYQVALDNDIDIRAIIELANAFQWSIDFAMDPRVDDTFKFVFEERFLDDKYIMPGKVLTGYYINDGTKYSVYYFEESEKNMGYFDQDGNSVQKIFLKAPVEFKYISSGYTTGKRVIMEFGLSGPHRAIDYAAPIGTPIRAVGDGTITFAGWSNIGYGYLTSIRHNSTYSTNYAHQSKILVKRGQKVKQGEIIGKVGSTGYSTGPHLHYEMVKNGVKINSLKEVLPPGKPIKDENKERFQGELEKYNELLK